mgnify:CR=1 FL=1
MRRGPSALNALIAIDKPGGCTSHDVVARVRRCVGERRVGHAGTLDPDATGVLVVGIGQATKLLGLLTLDRKGYRSSFVLGSSTTTDDASGEVLATAEVDPALLAEDAARRELAGLVGTFDQVPPAFSAVSVDGRRAYAMARDGKSVELAPRRVTVHAAELVEVRPETCEWVVDLDVSKGTYVRSIARDLGERLGCHAHVGQLRRSFSGPVWLGSCVSLDELEARGADLVHERCLDPAATLGLAVRELRVEEVADVTCEPRPCERVALCFDGGLVGIWERRGCRLACCSNFPISIEGVGA